VPGESLPASTETTNRRFLPSSVFSFNLPVLVYPSPTHRETIVTMLHRHHTLQPLFSIRRQFLMYRRLLVVLSFALIVVGLGCTARNAQNGNSTVPQSAKQNSNGNTNATPPVRSSQSDIVNIKEPDRYGVAMSMSAQGTGSDVPAPLVTQQFAFSRFDSD